MRPKKSTCRAVSCSGDRTQSGAGDGGDDGNGIDAGRSNVISVGHHDHINIRCREMPKYMRAMKSKQQCSVAWLYQGMRTSYPLPLTIYQITLYLFAHQLVLFNKKKCVKIKLF